MHVTEIGLYCPRLGWAGPAQIELGLGPDPIGCSFFDLDSVRVETIVCTLLNRVECKDLFLLLFLLSYPLYYLHNTVRPAPLHQEACQITSGLRHIRVDTFHLPSVFSHQTHS